MQNIDIVNGLLQLGFETGWVVNGTEITLWENPESIPTISEIASAVERHKQKQQAEAQAKAEAKAAAQAKLAALGLTIDDLTALGL